MATKLEGRGGAAQLKKSIFCGFPNQYIANVCHRFDVLGKRESHFFISRGIIYMLALV